MTATPKEVFTSVEAALKELSTAPPGEEYVAADGHLLDSLNAANESASHRLGRFHLVRSLPSGPRRGPREGNQRGELEMLCSTHNRAKGNR